MVVLKRKTRMLSLRLSEEEYASLHHASLATGSRSVSDFARDTLFGALDGDDRGASPLSTRMNQLASELESLNEEVHALRSVVVKPQNA